MVNMSYKSRHRVGSDEWWQKKIDDGVIKGRLDTGICILCGLKSSNNICKDCPKERKQ